MQLVSSEVEVLRTGYEMKQNQMSYGLPIVIGMVEITLENSGWML